MDQSTFRNDFETQVSKSIHIPHNLGGTSTSARKQELSNVIENVNLVNALMSGVPMEISKQLGKCPLADLYRGAVVDDTLRGMLAHWNILPLPIVAKLGDTFMQLTNCQTNGIMKILTKEASIRNTPIKLGKRKTSSENKQLGPLSNVEHQQQVVVGGCVTMGMGKGKTLMTLCICLSKSASTGNPSLVVTHKGVISVWRDNIEKFFKKGTVKVMYLDSDTAYKKLKPLSEYDLVVTSYDHCCSVFRKISINDLTDERMAIDLALVKISRLEEGDQIVPQLNRRTSNLGRRWQDTLPKVCNVPATQNASILYSTKWERIVCDESQRIANGTTQTARSMMALASRRRWCMTGTLFRNGISDVAAQLHFCGVDMLTATGNPIDINIEEVTPLIYNLDKVKCKSAITTTTAAAAASDTYKDRVTSTSTSVADVDAYSNKTNCSMSSESMKHPVMTCTKLKMTGRQFKLYKLMEHSYSQALSTERMTLAYISKLRQCAIIPHLVLDWIVRRLPGFKDTYPDIHEWLQDREGTAGLGTQKLERLVQIVKDVPPQDKLVVFSEYFEVIKCAAERLNLEKYDNRILDGSQKPKDRQINLEEFQSNPDVKVLFSTFQVGKEGLHLIVANHVVFMDMWWNDQVLEQALARCHRAGQSKTVHCYSMPTMDSVETYMGNVCCRKLKDMAQFQDVSESLDTYQEMLENETSINLSKCIRS